MKPHSNNIVFVDTEFSDLDPYTGEILSIGIVKPNGDELYIELEYDGEVHPWVKENILPSLTEPKVTREAAQEKITAFLGDEKPYMVAFVPQYDMIYMVKLFGVGNAPFHWMSIDFASMMFANDINPEGMLAANNEVYLKEIGIDPTQYREHHALDDAKMLREVYQKIVK
ncbi:MAG TPA: 3'-5' exoribonuclease [Patescibacteria group bacterium]|nr:3'-5' exoribonuclease [Patescibacteria group bacterium]|tara:strand:+ start:210 stop:719 length:510 start_codon:yes stop_codon:yes gene_type:complete